MKNTKNKIQHFTWLLRPGTSEREILDECKVSSWKNPKEDVEAYVKKTYREPSKIKICRIMDENKILQCPRELLWDSLIRQDCQGRCPYCGFEFVHFLGREKNRPENFKYCLGFGSSNIPGRDKFIILYECPECFEKSYFHIDEKWIYLYGEWIVDNSEVLE